MTSHLKAAALNMGQAQIRTAEEGGDNEVGPGGGDTEVGPGGGGQRGEPGGGAPKGGPGRRTQK